MLEFNWEFINEGIRSDVIVARLREVGLTEDEIKNDIQILNRVSDDPKRLSIFAPPTLAPNAETRDGASLRADSLNHLADNLTKMHHIAHILHELEKYNGCSSLLKHFSTPENNGLINQLYATLYLEQSIDVMDIECKPKSITEPDTDILGNVNDKRVNFHSVTKGASGRRYDCFIFLSEICSHLSACPIKNDNGQMLRVFPETDGILPPKNKTIRSVSVEMNPESKFSINANNLEDLPGNLVKFLRTIKNTRIDWNLSISIITEGDETPSIIRVKFGFTSESLLSGRSKGIDELRWLENEIEYRADKIPKENQDVNVIVYTNHERQILHYLHNDALEKITKILNKYGKIDALFFLDSGCTSVNDRDIRFKRSNLFCTDSFSSNSLCGALSARLSDESVVRI